MKPIVFTPDEWGRVERALGFQRSHLNPKKKYSLEIKEHRNRRSLDSNGYLWILIHKLAEVTGVPVTEIYRGAIKEIGGVSEHYCGKPDAIHRLCEVWEGKGLGWIAETYESKLPGMVNVTLYYGSSVYDAQQMGRLISNVVQDCKAVEIETLSPQELALMMEGWGAKGNKGNGDTKESERCSLEA